MGLKIAPSVYSRLMNLVLAGMDPLHICCYIDDILIVTEDVKSHLILMRELFERLEVAGIKMSPRKTEIGVTHLDYLGFRLTRMGLEVTDSKIESMKRMERPTTKKELKSKLGAFSYIRRFVPCYSMRVKVLQEMLKEGAKFEWTTAAEEAWQDILHCMTSPPVLRYPKMGWQYKLHCDAALAGTAFMLCQLEPEEVWKENNPEKAHKKPSERDSEHPIAYGSNVLLDYQKKYTITDLEL